MCGPLLSWKRGNNDPNKPQYYGVGEFDSLESIFICLKVIHNLRLFDNNINVRTEKDTTEYLQEWAKQKEEEWVMRQERAGTYDSGEIAVLKARGEILPFERLLIPNYDQIVEDINEALRDSGSILNKELNFIGGQDPVQKLNDNTEA